MAPNWSEEIRKVEEACAKNEQMAREIRDASGFSGSLSSVLNRVFGGKEVVVGYKYSLEYSASEQEFEMKATAVKKRGIVIVQETPFDPTTLIDIPETFNDKLDYKGCTTFEQACTLNSELKRVADKYELFGGNARAMEFIVMFLHNLKAIHAYLVHLQHKLDNATPESFSSVVTLNQAYNQVRHFLSQHRGANCMNELERLRAENARLQRQVQDMQAENARLQRQVHDMQARRCTCAPARPTIPGPTGPRGLPTSRPAGTAYPSHH